MIGLRPVSRSISLTNSRTQALSWAGPRFSAYSMSSTGGSEGCGCVASAAAYSAACALAEELGRAMW